MATLRILGEDDVRALIDTECALAIAREQLLDQALGRSILSSPAAMALDARRLGGPQFKFKAATTSRLGASGIRLITRATVRADASHYCAVYNHDGTALSGLVSELWLSRIRTAAFGAAIIEHLVNPGPVVVALFGTGAVAREIAPMLARTLDVAELRVHSRSAENSSEFVREHAPALDCPMRPETDSDRVAVGADVVVTVTSSETPFVFAGMLQPGAVVCSMGNANEVDYGVLLDAQRLIVDDADFASEAGDGAAWIAQGHLSRSQFAARIDAIACDVISGKCPGRIAGADRIVALIQGMAIGDIAFAAHALNEARRLGRGTVVDLPASTPLQYPLLDADPSQATHTHNEE